MWKHSIRYQLFSVFVIGLLSGCGQQGRKLQLIPVSGSVTLEGTPLQDGIVSLESSSTGFAAAALLDKDGKFLIPKLPTGTYRVAVGPPPPPAPGEPATPRSSDLGPLRTPPEKYGSIQTSELAVTVLGIGDEELQIEIP
jgi:hypothetical protein